MMPNAFPNCCSAQIHIGMGTYGYNDKKSFAKHVYDYFTKQNGKPQNCYSFDMFILNETQRKSWGKEGLQAAKAAGFKLVGGPSWGNHNASCYLFVRSNNPVKKGSKLPTRIREFKDPFTVSKKAPPKKASPKNKRVFGK